MAFGCEVEYEVTRQAVAGQAPISIEQLQATPNDLMLGSSCGLNGQGYTDAML